MINFVCLDPGLGLYGFDMNFVPGMTIAQW
jgi:hypothetical protein